MTHFGFNQTFKKVFDMCDFIEEFGLQKNTKEL